MRSGSGSEARAVSTATLPDVPICHLPAGSLVPKRNRKTALAYACKLLVQTTCNHTVATVLVQHACDISNSTQGQKKALPKAVIKISLQGS